jgi:CheY-like chemotaxis protein
VHETSQAAVNFVQPKCIDGAVIGTSAPEIWKWTFQIGGSLRSDRRKANLPPLAAGGFQLRIHWKLKKPCATNSRHEMSRVLVVDDEDDLRSAIAMVLRIKGFEVVAVEGGAAGLQEFDATSFELAVIDIFLQGAMGGIELIRMQRELDPSVPIIAISGVTALDFLTHYPELSDVVRLPKPFRPTELMLAIEEATHSKLR